MIAKNTITDPKHLGLVTLSFLYGPRVNIWRQCLMLRLEAARNMELCNLVVCFWNLLYCDAVFAMVVELPLLFLSWEGDSQMILFFLLNCYESIPRCVITILTKSWGQKSVRWKKSLVSRWYFRYKRPL